MLSVVITAKKKGGEHKKTLEVMGIFISLIILRSITGICPNSSHCTYLTYAVFCIYIIL